MPQTVIPGSDSSRDAFIKTALETSTKNVAKGKEYLMTATHTKLVDFAPQFAEKFADIISSKGKRLNETNEKQTAYAHLVMNVSHVMHSIKNRVQRRGEPSTVLSYYQLPQTGIFPELRPNSKIITTAEKIILGDAAAVTAGYEPVTNPDAAELQAAIDQAKIEQSEFYEADSAYDEAAEELAEVRDSADDIIRDIIDDLEYNLRKMDDASRRRIMRTYGVEFISASGETVAE